MVKKNKLLIGCLTLLLVLSVGYALFSETITINGSATAKGSFDITTTCTPGYSDEFITAMGSPDGGTNDIGQNGFANSVCDVKENTVTMSTELLYPTANRFFMVKMINTGSIPALIWGTTDSDGRESLDISKSASWFLKNKETNEIIKSGNTNSINDKYRYISGFGTYVFSSEGILFSDENVIYDKNRGYAGIKLNPGDSVFALMEFKYPNIPGNLMSDNGLSEYFEFKLNHEFKWEQYTDSPNYESTTFDEWCFAGC